MVVAVLHQPVGVKQENAARRYIHLSDLERQTAYSERRAWIEVDKFECPIRTDDSWRRMPRDGHGAAAGDRIVYRIQTCTRQSVLVGGFRADDAKGEVVEVHQQFVGPK